MNTEPDDDPNADTFTERIDVVNQAFQRLLASGSAAVIWGDPAPRTKDDKS